MNKLDLNVLLQRVDPLIDKIELDAMSVKLADSLTSMEGRVGFSTPDYAKRLLILSDQGVISDEEYVSLVFHYNDTLLAGRSQFEGRYTA